jgi:acyl-CoA dehydrogenase
MPSYKAPVEDVLFLLRDVFQIDRYNNLPSFADATPDVIEAILGEAAKLCEEVLQPLNLSGDREGCVRQNERHCRTHWPLPSTSSSPPPIWRSACIRA